MMKFRSYFLVFFFSLFCIFTSCTKKKDTAACSPAPAMASCGSGNQLLGTLPVSAAEIRGWVPLGQMNPLGHLLPTDHQYLYLINSGIDLVAPSNITVVEATSSYYSSTGNTDYKIKFLACKEVQGLFMHVVSIDSNLLSQLGAFNQNCFTYGTTGTAITTCSTAAAAVSVSEGTKIGTARGTTSAALDFTLWDSRTSSQFYSNTTRNAVSTCDGFDRYHIVPASDYFVTSLQSTIASKLGSFDGVTQRTIAPIGGQLNYDVADSAQGYWYSAASPGSSPEDPHLSLAPDNIDPTKQVISIGSSQPNGYLGNPNLFTPTNSGTVDRDFSQVTSDGNIYCYAITGFTKVFLIQMPTSQSLKIEYQTGMANCAAAAPYIFTANAFTYER